MWPLLEYKWCRPSTLRKHMIKHRGEKQNQRKRWVAAYLPPFSPLSNTLQPTLCVAPNFTYLASVFTAVIPKPASSCPQPSHHSRPGIGQKNLWLLRNNSKKQLQCCQICCTPILLVLAQGSDFSACCIIFRASSSPFFALFSNHPVHSFVHRFQRSGRNTRSG